MIDASERRRNLLIYLCLAVATAVVYSPVRRFQFINFYDDSAYVTENPHVRAALTTQGLAWAFANSYSGNWHPLTWISHMLDCQFFGLNSGGHHLVNVAFHVANTLLLFGVLNRMTAAPWRSAFVAALFALHPLHVESVAWVAERKDVLSALFWMLTMWAYVRYTEQFTVLSSRSSVGGSDPEAFRPKSLHSPRSTLHVYYALALLFFALGLMSKPMVVTLPFVLLLLDYWPLERTPWTKSGTGRKASFSPSQLLKEKVPFFVLAAVLCGITFWAQRRGGAVMSLEHLPVGERATNAVVSYVRYLGKVFWPTGLAVFYPHQNWPWAAVAGAGAILIAVSAWVIRRARREPQLLAGWLWYLGTLVPVIGLVQVGFQSMADRYAYLPSIGLFIMVAWIVPPGMMERHVSRVAAAATAAVLLLVCAAFSWSQIQYWKNGETLFRHALDVTANNFVAHLNLGSILAQGGDVQEAIGHWEQALRIKPDYAEAHNNLGAALSHEGRTQEALQHYEQALRIKPDYAGAHCSLGIILEQTGKVQEAIDHYEQAVRIDPDYTQAHNSLGLALYRAGRIQEAIRQFEQAVGTKPDDADAQNNLAVALKKAGRIQEAIGHYVQAARFNPHSAEVHYNLGVALEQVGRVQEAFGEYDQAVQIKPGYADAHNSMAIVLWRVGRARDAIGHWEQALRTSPDYAEAHNNLGLALEQTGKLQEAIAHYEQALRIKPDYAEANYNVGNALFQSGKVPEAIRHWEEALRIKPDYLKAHYNLGVALEQAGRVPEARGHYEQALRLKPDYADAQKGLARLRAAQ